MMTFEQGEKLMKEMNTTPAELDMMWDACAKAGHSLISQLSKCGKGWRDLNTACIKTLPGEYYKIVKSEASGS